MDIIYSLSDQGYWRHDAFEEFLKNGITDHTTSMRFKEEILEEGDAEDLTDYHNFKGRERW